MGCVWGGVRVSGATPERMCFLEHRRRLLEASRGRFFSLGAHRSYQSVACRSVRVLRGRSGPRGGWLLSPPGPPEFHQPLAGLRGPDAGFRNSR